MICALTIVLLAGCTAGGFGAQVRYAPEEYFTAESDIALARAVAADDVEDVRRLVGAGASVDASGKYGVTMLQFAILNNRLDPVRALLAAGADPEKVGDGGRSAVHTAAAERDPDYLDALLDAGADPNVQDAAGSVPLISAILNASDAPFTRLMEEADLDVNLANANSDAPIHTAARTNAGRYLLMLLERGADPRASNSGGATFQDYYFSYPENVLNERAKAERREIVAWLRANGVPLHPKAPR